MHRGAGGGESSLKDRKILGGSLSAATIKQIINSQVSLQLPPGLSHSIAKNLGVMRIFSK